MDSEDALTTSANFGGGSSARPGDSVPMAARFAVWLR